MSVKALRQSLTSWYGRLYEIYRAKEIPEADAHVSRPVWLERGQRGKVTVRVDWACAAEGVGLVATPSLRRWLIEGLTLLRDYAAASDVPLRLQLEQLHVRLDRVRLSPLADEDPVYEGVDPEQLTLLLETLAAVPADRWVGFARTVRRLTPELYPHPDQTVSTATCGIPTKRLAHRHYRSTVPSVAPPLPAVMTAAPSPAFEARWLLSCNSLGQGVRRAQNRLLVDPKVYVRALAATGRPSLLRGLIGQLDGPEAAAQAAALLRDLFPNPPYYPTPAEVLEASGLYHPEPESLLVFSARVVERVCGGRRASIEFSRVAKEASAYQRPPEGLMRPYADRELEVRRFHGALYFETPTPLPLNFLREAGYSLRGQRVVKQGVPLWALGALEKWVRLHPDDEEMAVFHQWARHEAAALSGDAYEAAAAQARRERAVARYHTGLQRHVGPYREQDNLIRDHFALRPYGAFTAAELQALCEKLPGRKPSSVKKRVRLILNRQAKSMGWRRFRESSYWPGGRMAQAIYASMKGGSTS